MAMLPLAVMDAMNRAWKSLFAHTETKSPDVVHLHHFASAWDRQQTEELSLETA